MRRRISSLLLLVATMMAVIGCSPTDFSFTVEQCVYNESLPYEGIVAQEWLDESTLLVHGIVTTFCGGANIKGSYKLEGDDLTLTYNIKTGGAVTTCECRHKVIYHISGLEKKDYLVILERN